MKHGSETASALLGMPGFVVRAHDEVDGELRLRVETTAEVAACPDCGTRAVGHGRRPTRVRDLSLAGRPVVLCWEKRRWRCPDPDCARRTWMERSDQVRPRSSLTERARREMCRRVGQDGDSVAEVARAFGVGWHAAMGAVAAHGRPLVEDPNRIAPTDAVGIDDRNFSRPGARRRSAWATVVIDLRRHQVLDVIPGRSQGPLRAWLDAQPAWWCQGVRLVGTDLHESYRSAATRPPKGSDVPARLAHAQVVADPFHVVAVLNDHLLRARLRVQRETLGRRGRKGDPLWDIRRLLLVGAERLGAANAGRLAAGLAAGDPTGQLREAWATKELGRSIYLTDEADEAAARLDALVARCRASRVPECRSLVRFLTRWREPILAHHRHEISNAKTEALNLSIAQLVRKARGFRRFDNYRLRVLLSFGVKWQTPPVARIRGRQPHLVA